MDTQKDILELAQKQPILQDEMQLIRQSDSELSGNVRYSFRSYKMLPHWSIEDTGMMLYHYVPKDTKSRYLELRFCVAAHSWCAHEGCGGKQCKIAESADCYQKENTLDIYHFRFNAAYLSPFVNKKAAGRSDKILGFKLRNSFTKMVSLCGKTRMVLENLQNNPYEGAMGTLFVNTQLQSLLFYAMECLVEEKGDTSFSCKFLANEDDRAKIIRAREVLLQHIGHPITIRELSRKVAINECYLKKGFKEIFGTTIFDFYQEERMKYARKLLYEKGASVTEVSLLLGYSSISHFSTAFKKHTGLKPCELLIQEK